jgi:protein-disulfide isomerase
VIAHRWAGRGPADHEARLLTGPDADSSCTRSSPTGQISLLENPAPNLIRPFVPRLVPLAFAALMVAPALASSQYANPGGGVSLAGVGHDRGGAAARVFIVEFGDFGCSYCAKFNVETFPKIDSAYIGGGTVRWKMVPFVTGMFKNSREVAEAAECAGEQGGFWRMHDLLYAKRKEWMASKDIRALVVKYASQVNLDLPTFGRCQMNPEIRRRILRHDALAQQLAIRGTPTFYVNGRVVPGAIPFDLFQQVITQAAR